MKIYYCFSQAPVLTVIIGAKCSDGIVLVAYSKFTALDGGVRVYAAGFYYILFIFYY
jgi:hypothetical protein